MRTPEERTSGAWTGGCDVTPDGGHEKTALQATGNTATQRTLRGQIRQVLFFYTLENLSQTAGPKKPRGQIGSESRKEGLKSE